MSTPETDYPCVGVCLNDAETGYCLGCGRPPAATPGDEATPADARREDTLQANRNDPAPAAAPSTARPD